jgi:hypothetical protein
MRLQRPVGRTQPWMIRHDFEGIRFQSPLIEGHTYSDRPQVGRLLQGIVLLRDYVPLFFFGRRIGIILRNFTNHLTVYGWVFPSLAPHLSTAATRLLNSS